MERDFEEEEVRVAVFDLGSNKASGSDSFPMVFFQWFWTVIKADFMAFMLESLERQTSQECRSILYHPYS